MIVLASGRVPGQTGKPDLTPFEQAVARGAESEEGVGIRHHGVRDDNRRNLLREAPADDGQDDKRQRQSAGGRAWFAAARSSGWFDHDYRFFPATISPLLSGLTK